MLSQLLPSALVQTCHKRKNAKILKMNIDAFDFRKLKLISHLGKNFCNFDIFWLNCEMCLAELSVFGNLNVVHFCSHE